MGIFCKVVGTCPRRTKENECMALTQCSMQVEVEDCPVCGSTLDENGKCNQPERHS